jgi:hypothetical protein
MTLKDKLISLLGGTPPVRPVQKPPISPLAQAIISLMQQSSHDPLFPEMGRQDAARALFADAKGDGINWKNWCAEAKVLVADLPGWSPCRFFHRISETRAAGVYGAVRRDFGIWRMPFSCCDRDLDEEEHEAILPTLTYLPAGMDIGLFDTMEVAREAAKIAEEQDWSKLPPPDETPGNREAWNAHMHDMRKIWQFNGISYSESKHAHHESDGAPIGIMVLTDPAAGRPKVVA